MDETRPDMSVNGINNAPGGHYRNVTIEGVGKVMGDVQADGLFRMNGVVTVLGDIQAAEFNADGKFKMEGRLAAGSARINGMAAVKGMVSGETLLLQGMLNANGDCELERFEAEGGFTIGGLLNAGAIDIRMHTKCKAQEVGGETIRVRKMSRSAWEKLWRWMFPKWLPEMEAALIEGDEVDLENTTASIVRGNRVVIGAGCHIDRVEYRMSIVKHPGAQVKEEVKIGDGNNAV